MMNRRFFVGGFVAAPVAVLAPVPAANAAGVGESGPEVILHINALAADLPSPALARTIAEEVRRYTLASQRNRTR